MAKPAEPTGPAPDDPTPDPTPKKGRDWVEPFLSALASYGVVTYAAKRAKINRSIAYELRAADPAFAARWQDAVEQATELLEAEANRRARLGTLRPVFQKGELVGKVREYSDTLLIFLLKALKPHVYRDGNQADSLQGIPADVVARLLALLAARQPQPGGPRVPPPEPTQKPDPDE